jgi:hypothetical protein
MVAEARFWPTQQHPTITSFASIPISVLLSAYEEKIPARNATYAHAQNFAASDELLLAILKTLNPQPLKKQQTDRLSRVLMNSMWFNVEHYHNTHSTQYRCTHYTLLSAAWCFQSVCSSVTPWRAILFSTNSSPLVHPTVNFPHRTAPEPPPPCIDFLVKCWL